jgi:hypothetical protein
MKWHFVFAHNFRILKVEPAYVCMHVCMHVLIFHFCLLLQDWKLNSECACMYVCMHLCIVDFWLHVCMSWLPLFTGGFSVLKVEPAYVCIHARICMLMFCFYGNFGIFKLNSALWKQYVCILCVYVYISLQGTTAVTLRRMCLYICLCMSKLCVYACMYLSIHESTNSTQGFRVCNYICINVYI